MFDAYDVVCIGGGVSGLYTAKYMLEQKLSVVVLEKEKEIGGVWCYRDTPGGVIKSTITTSSKTVTESSDYPIRSESDFPSHVEFQNYLLGYVAHFNLEKNILCDIFVTHTEKIDQEWHVRDANGRCWKGKHLVVATGANTHPNIPNDLQNLFKTFPGKMMHSSMYKEPTEEYNGRILLVGGGETSADIASELSYYAKHIHLSIPNGQWFGDRYGGLLNRFPLEHFSSRLRRWIIDGDKNPDLFRVLKAYTEHFGGFQGHGIECWRTKYDAYATSFINKNTSVLERIKQGYVTPKPGIERVEGKRVFFKDGSSDEFDLVMFSTGYVFDTKWLKIPQKGLCISKLYKMFLVPEDPSLAFIGFVRPVRGSIPSGAEIQAWMYSYIVSGKMKLPTLDEMNNCIAKERKIRDLHFNGSNSRIVTLAPIYDYCDDMAKLMGVFPNYRKLYKEVGFTKWLRVLRAPFHMSQYRLHTKEGLEYHLETIERFLPNTPYNILLWATMGRFLHAITSSIFLVLLCGVVISFLSLYVLMQ